MRVRLAYGEVGLDLEVPDDATVVEGAGTRALGDEAGAIRRSLRAPTAGPPLDRLVPPTGRVVVVFPDITRPMPNTTVLPPLLEELDESGAGPGRVELICATGTHRQASAPEMAGLIGRDLLARYPVRDHRADDGEHVAVGEVDGAPVLFDRHYVEADLRILTGFVEPHFFAGWSGGPKGTCPGLAATETIFEAHSPARIAAADATWMTTEGNPVHDFVRAATDLCPPALSLDVTIDRDRRLTGAFTGPLPEGHRQACAFAAGHMSRPVEGRFDVVVTTNGGHPLDRNLYQAVKGMAAAERVVRDGGIILMAAACGDGVPPGPFAGVLAAASDPDELVTPEGAAQDVWQAQVLARVLRRAEVWMYSDGLAEEDLRAAWLRPVHDLAGAMEEALARRGPGARVCVLPRGPLVVATPRQEVLAG
jgi:nickel-dependent lactate racemase